jgi:hypothetical protein
VGSSEVKKLMADYISDCQLEWARRENIPLDGRYTIRLEDNIFGGEFHPETWKEYTRGKGHELEGKRAHMKALHSSSALVVNVFDYWRRQNRIKDIAGCCGVEGSVTDMEFEKTHPIKGVEGTPPHLDIEFAVVVRLAIESKFTETYRRATRRPLAKTKLDVYLENDDIWGDMPKLKDLAQDIVQQSGTGTEFQYLDVHQLIKHILGLKCSYGRGFSLLYLWYKIDSKEATQHDQELAGFRNRINSDLSFRTMTYQGLFESIKHIPNVDTSYLKYLEQRYFSIS